MHLVDTTLRDGEQTAGVAFDAETRLRIATMLDEIGVPELEVGIPAMGKEECDNIRAIQKRNLSCRLTGWCRARTDDLEAACACGLKAVHFSFPVSDIHLGVLGKKTDWLFDGLRILIKEARSKFDFISIGAQDASRTDTDMLRQFITAARNAGAHRVRLADTVGIWNPMQTYSVISELKASVPSIILGFHGHNDLGMACANAVSAFQAGADSIDVTVNGLGERAGNSALEEVVMATEISLGITSRIKTSKLTEVCNFVSEAAHRALHESKPIVGSAVFRHESGIHVHALLKDSRAYEPFNPELAGHTPSEFIIGKHSGSAGIKHTLAANGLTLADSDTPAFLTLVRSTSDQKHRSLTSDELISLYNTRFAG